MDQDFNERPKTLKLLIENTSRYWHRQELFVNYSNSLGNNSRNRQIGLHRIKNFHTAREMVNNEETDLVQN